MHLDIKTSLYLCFVEMCWKNRITFLSEAVAAKQKMILMGWFRRSSLCIKGYVLMKQQLKEF